MLLNAKSSKEKCSVLFENTFDCCLNLSDVYSAKEIVPADCPGQFQLHECHWVTGKKEGNRTHHSLQHTSCYNNFRLAAIELFSLAHAPHF